MRLTREELEASLAAMASEIDDPRAGIHGPESVSWIVDRESALLLGGGAAALLQLAHPAVAHAVDQHSATRHDPVGRFRRTFERVFGMVFGDLEHAFEAARAVHGVHRKIRGVIDEDVGRFARGSRYEANDPEALFWVHATLLDTSVKVFERLLRALTVEEKGRFYEESKRFARLFAIPDSLIPPDWAAFREYYERTLASETVAVGAPAAEMGRFILQAPRPIHIPFTRFYRVFTAMLLPEKLRAPFGLENDASHIAKLEAAMPWLSAGYRRLPGRLRFFPAYVEATRRVAGKRPHDRVGRALEKVVLRSLEPSKAFWAREEARGARRPA